MNKSFVHIIIIIIIIIIIYLFIYCNWVCTRFYPSTDKNDKATLYSNTTQYSKT
jgi:uncharacterized protein YxeA